MASLFKLRCTIIGHDSDVRTLTTSPQHGDAIISGSRDRTTRIWTPNDADVGFKESHKMQDHSNFVASVCVVPPNSTNEQGLILTGSNDKMIMVYDLQTFEKLYQLTGHEGTVCCLCVGKAGTIISGSWDKTAKVWIKERCVMTLEGHEAAVWAVSVIADQGLMLTASADKTIRVWKAGRCETVISGHTDCVRGLAVLSNGQFLSCSNDGTIRRWLVNGECLHIYYGHENFVYSLAVLPNEEGFVSTGEDKTLRIWHNTSCIQTIAHPCPSVWSVCVLQNGDIVTAGSDAMMRVFTQCAERMATAEEQQVYEDLVTVSNAPSKIAGVKLEDIPGVESLQNAGQPGQQKMVRSGNKVMMYLWESNSNQWELQGEVTGSGTDDHASTGKTWYKGKEYDYVFTVDIGADVPSLKLPYNTIDNPLIAAQNFLHANELDPIYLEKVVNFIIINTRAAQQHGDPATMCSDPFTGGRYLPGSASGDQSIVVPTKPANTYYPRKTYVTIDAANEKQILEKLHEFNKKVDEPLQVPDASIDGLSILISEKTSTPDLVTTLKALLQWPKDYVFPALDVLRIGIKLEAINEHFCSPETGKEIIQFLAQYISGAQASNANKILALRILSNMFLHKPGEAASMNERETVLSILSSCIPGANKGIQIALATILLNYSVIFLSNNDYDGKAQCMNITKEFFEGDKMDQEAVFRLLVMLGNLVHEDEIVVGIGTSLCIENYIKNFSDTELNAEKVSSCARFLLDEFKVL